MENKKHLEKLRKALPKGATAEVASRTGKHPATVSRVLSGQWVNEEVIAAAVEVAKEHRYKVEAQRARIAEQVNQAVA